MTIQAVRSAIAAGEATATGFAEEHYTRIAARIPLPGGDRDQQLSRAQPRARPGPGGAHRSMPGREAGDPLPPLAGVPIGIKDVLTMTGTPATAGSKILQGLQPPYDATAVHKLEAAGAVLLGKLNCDEFAMGSSNENSAYGPVRNPRALDRVPGGSSGGSAAAVAAGFCVASLGTDTGGSIRQPAAFCGVVGVTPTYGRVSRYGLIAFASSLDRVGPFATQRTRCRHHAAACSPARTRWTPPPPTARSADYTAAPSQPGRRPAHRRARRVLRRGSRPRNPRGHRTSPGQPSRAAGCHITTHLAPAHPLRHPHLLRPRHRRGLGEPVPLRRRPLRLPRRPAPRPLARCSSRPATKVSAPEVKRRILLGTYALSAGYYDAYYRKAQQVRTLLTRDFLTAFTEVDAIVCPGHPDGRLQARRKDRTTP